MKRWVVALFSAVFAVTAAGCAASDSLGESGNVKLIAAHVTDEKSPYQLGMETFKEVVEKESGGTIQVEIHPNGQLGGNEDELVQKMASGSVDVTVAAPGFMAQTIPEMEFFAMPYLFENLEHWGKVVDGDVGEQVAGIIGDKTDFEVLGYWTAGVRNYYGFRPIEKPEDLKGVKIRVQNSPVIKDTWSAYGAQPTHVAWNELYQALQNKVVDASENDFTNIYQSKQHEVAKYLSLTEHDIATRLFMISQQKFESLTEDQQQAILTAAEAATAAEREADIQLADESRAKLEEEGVTINEVDKAPFVEKTKAIRERTAERIGLTELYEQVKAGE